MIAIALAILATLSACGAIMTGHFVIRLATGHHYPTRHPTEDDIDRALCRSR